LAEDTDGAPIHALDLGDFLEDGFGSGFGIHGKKVYAIHIYFTTKKALKL